MSNIIVSPPADKVRFIDYRNPIWGDSYNWAFARRLDQVSKLAIHHSVTIHDATPDDIALLHKARGWGGIGYHFVITKDGTIYYVGDIGTGRANIANNNEKIIGICLVGDFTRFLPTSAQIFATKYLCEYFMNSFPALVNIRTWEDVIGHQEAIKFWPNATATACPASNWKNVADGIYYRMRDGIGYEPVTPPPPPNPNPNPPTDMLYRVTQMGIQLGAFKANPIAVIEAYKKLEDQLKTVIYGSPKGRIDKLRKLLPQSKK